MNRQEFMAQLERLLWDIPENDRLDAIAYYNDYFDEAGAENEAHVIQELGSPGKVAAIIKADLNTGGNENAEYTERGYEDGRRSESAQPLSRKETGYHEPKGKVKLPLALIIILLVFASPILLGLGGGAIGVIMGVFGALIGIVAAVLAGCIAGFAGGIASLAYGIARVAFYPMQGLLYIGVGALSLAVGILLLILVLWCAVKWIPALFRVVVNFIQRLLYRGKRRNQV